MVWFSLKNLLLPEAIIIQICPTDCVQIGHIFLFKSFLFQHTFIQNANLWPHSRAPHCCEVSSVSI